MTLVIHPATEPNRIELTIRGPIARAGARWLGVVEALLADDGNNLIICDLAGVTVPDAGTIDTLARLELITSRNGGGRVQLHNPSHELQELLDLAGLWTDLEGYLELDLEPRGKTEQREQILRIEEETDAGDPPV